MVSKILIILKKRNISCIQTLAICVETVSSVPTQETNVLPEICSATIATKLDILQEFVSREKVNKLMGRDKAQSQCMWK